MNSEQKTYLKERLVDAQYSLGKRKQEKKEMSGGFNRTIKELEKRIDAFTLALKLDDPEQIESVVYEAVYVAFCEMGRD